MISFSKMKVVILILLVGLCLPALVLAQDWSAKQQEVWKSVEAHWQALSLKDLEGFLSYVHPDYTGFTNFRPLPITKDTLKKWIGSWMQGTDVIVYEIQPVTIQVYDNFAIVNYFYSSLEKSGDGKVTKPSRRYSSTWVKQKDKWAVLNAHLEDIP